MVTRRLHSDDVPLDFERAYKFLKIRKASPKFAMMHDLVADLYARYRTEFEPCYRYKISRVVSGQSGSFSIFLEDGVAFSGRGIHRVLMHCRYAASFVITVGGRIDEKMAILAQQDFTEAFFLDGIASAVTHGVQRILEQELRSEARQLGCEPGSRFAPGYARWDLTEQKKLFELLKADELGMQLSEAYFMTPQKSVSGVYGFHPTAKSRSVT